MGLVFVREVFVRWQAPISRCALLCCLAFLQRNRVRVAAGARRFLTCDRVVVQREIRVLCPRTAAVMQCPATCVLLFLLPGRSPRGGVCCAGQYVLLRQNT